MGKQTKIVDAVKLPIRKVCRIGTIQVGGRRASVHIKIATDRAYLSISGVIGALPSGNCLGSCGQIDMEFAHRHREDNDTRYNSLIRPRDINFAKGWDCNKWLDLLDVWKDWHCKDIVIVPLHVKEFINELPDADIKPAWA